MKLRKLYLSIASMVLAAGLPALAKAQCSATISASPQTATCGNKTIGFQVGYTVATTFDFNSGTLPTGWASSPYTVGKPCVTNTPDNTSYFWATATNSANIRFVQTSAVNVSAGGNIVFKMRYGSDDPALGCEDPDLTNEGVFLQYSTNGTTWVPITSWTPNGTRTGPLYIWTTYTIPIPTGAIGPNTSFRWYQPSNSGTDFDNWGLEDVTIQASVGGIASYSWNFGDGSTATTANPSHTYATAGNYTVSMALTFTGGCIANATTNVSVVSDVTAPTITSAGLTAGTATTSRDGLGNCSTTVALGTPTATDNCSVASLVASVGGTTINPTTYAFPIGTTVVKWTATDGAGNFAFINQNVTVTDNEAPIPTVAALPTINEECAATVTAPTATDNCAGTITATTSNPTTYTAQGTYTINWTYNDGHGNTTNQQQTVVVKDEFEPTISGMPNSREISNDINLCGAVINWVTPTAVDNCTASTVVQTAGPASGSLFPIGSTMVSYTASDANGNSGTENFIVTVRDNQAPTVTVPAAISHCDNGQGNNHTLAATATDNCAISTVTYAITGATTGNGTGTSVNANFNIGTSTITWTAKDNANKTTTGSTTVTIWAQPTVSVTGTDAQCFGGNTGTVAASVTGGTPNYNYAWTPGSGTSASLNNVTAGTYDVVVSDNHGCTASGTYTVQEPAELIATATKTDVSCNGGSNGTVSIDVTGGTASYSYIWNNNSTNEDLTNVIAGTYSVTVTDAHGCMANTAATVGEPAMITIMDDVTNASCFGRTNGRIDITTEGGTVPYSFSWSNNSTSESINGLGAGTYDLTVTDAHGCTATGSYTVTEPALLTATATKTNVTCNGGANGTIDLTVTGGTPNYRYSWNNNASTQDLTGLPASAYSVTVTDGKECTATTTVTIQQPAALSISGVSNNVTCSGAGNGSIDITPAGGQGTYTYNWSNNATTQDINGLNGGSYTVTVADGADAACTTSRTFTITEPTMLTVSGVVSNVLCNGGSTGAVNITATGGTAPYAYNWGGNGSNEDISGLAAGTYGVTVTDANGCNVSGTYTVSEPNALVASTTQTNVLCNGGANGSINVVVTGGTANYAYVWSNSTITTANRTGLSAGTYSVVVTDAHGCIANTSATITAPAPLTIADVTTNVSCNGGNNGAVNITVSGGTTGYAYNWGNNVTTEDRAGLMAGTYAVVVTDAHGCTANGTYTITQPQTLTVTAAQTNVSCNGGNNGALNITVNGGTSPYNYNWGTTAQEDRTGLAAGTYTVNVVDAHGCTISGAYTITQPMALTLTGTAVNATCNGRSNGTVTINPGGGTAPYSYKWNGVTGPQNLSGKPAGTYNVVVTDAKGCTIGGSYTIGQPTMLVVGAITPSTTYVTGNCSAYTIYLGYGSQTIGLSVSPVGGTGAYSYLWTPSGATTASTTVSPGSTTVYNVTVTDANGCTASSNNGGASTGFTVRVKDVRCGNNNDKVLVCHNNGNVICVSPSAVPAHIGNHGDCLGDCTNTNARGTAPTSHIDLEEGSVTVYPNPAHGKISVALKEIGAPYRSFQITDVNGRVVTNQTLTGDVHTDVISVDISSYAPGMYIIRAVTDGGASLSKFTVK